MQNMTQEDINKVYEAFLKMNTIEECEAFISDLCTSRELEAFALRLKAASLLNEGKTYEQVINEINISSTTLSRVSRSLHYGTGYKNVLKSTKK